MLACFFAKPGHFATILFENRKTVMADLRNWNRESHLNDRHSPVSFVRDTQKLSAVFWGSPDCHPTQEVYGVLKQRASQTPYNLYSF
nr:hypothetical protein BaRGS_021435 [Batillaria attramentaria]